MQGRNKKVKITTFRWNDETGGFDYVKDYVGANESECLRQWKEEHGDESKTP